MDLTRNILFRDFLLNDEELADDQVPFEAVGDGIDGCVVDSVDYSDVDVVQYTEKKAQTDGHDAGDVFLGMRRIRMAGTLYATTRALLYDALADLRAALSPTLSYRDEPADKGYQPIYFSVPTNRVEDYPAGAIDMRTLAMPRAFSAIIQRDQQGGEDDDALAIPWQATFVQKDPTLMGELPVEVEFTATTVVTGATAAAATNLVTKASHGLTTNDRVYFTTLTGGTGLSLATVYYVIAGGLTSSTFSVSLTQGGSAVDITVNYTDVSFAEPASATGDFAHRGNYHAPLNMIFVVTAAAGTIAVTAGGSQYTITLPASSGQRIVRFKGADKVITVEEASVETLSRSILSFTADTTWPLVPPGSSPYTVSFSGGLVLLADSQMWFWEAYA